MLINGSLNLSRAVLTEIDHGLFLRLRIRRGTMLLALAGLFGLFGRVARRSWAPCNRHRLLQIQTLGLIGTLLLVRLLV